MKIQRLIKVTIISMALMIASNTNVSAEEVNPTENISKATQLIELNPNGRNYLIRATIYSHNQNYELAIADCNQALSLGYDDDEVYEVRAMSYLNLDKADEAIADCDHIIANNPKNSAAYKIRAGAYVLKNDYDASLADCKSALELDPTDEDLKSRMHDIEQLKIARDSDPQAKEMDLFAVGMENFKAQRFDKAIENFTKMLELNSKNVTALKLRGAAYAASNDLDKAIVDWEKALELNPDDASVKDWLNKAHSAKDTQ